MDFAYLRTLSARDFHRPGADGREKIKRRGIFQGAAATVLSPGPDVVGKGMQHHLSGSADLICSPGRTTLRIGGYDSVVIESEGESAVCTYLAATSCFAIPKIATG